MLGLSEWPVIRMGLRSWTPGPSDSDGCIQLSRGTPVQDINWNCHTGPVPALVLLEKLFEAGWQPLGPGQPEPEGHTLQDTPGFLVLSNSGPVASKPYLQCLVCLQDILTDKFPSLPTGQPSDFYVAVLHAASPESIQAGQPA